MIITILFFIIIAIYATMFDLVYTFILTPFYKISNKIFSSTINKYIHYFFGLFTLPIYYGGKLVDAILRINQKALYPTSYDRRWKEYFKYLKYMNDIIPYYELILCTSPRYPIAVRIFQHLNTLWYSLGLKPDLCPSIGEAKKLTKSQIIFYNIFAIR